MHPGPIPIVTSVHGEDRLEITAMDAGVAPVSTQASAMATPSKPLLRQIISTSLQPQRTLVTSKGSSGTGLLAGEQDGGEEEEEEEGAAEHRIQFISREELIANKISELGELEVSFASLQFLCKRLTSNYMYTYRKLNNIILSYSRL